jgi:hypothetical protein
LQEIYIIPDIDNVLWLTVRDSQHRTDHTGWLNQAGFGHIESDPQRFAPKACNKGAGCRVKSGAIMILLNPRLALFF